MHEEAKRLITFIRNLPTSLWNIEVERFLEQLTSEKVALTGMQFFTITKSLILKVKLDVSFVYFFFRLKLFTKLMTCTFQIVGTVVTYELVMLKFKEADEEKHVDKNPCL